MRFKPVFAAVAAAVALTVALTGCSADAGPSKEATENLTAPTTEFIANGFYELEFTEKSFTSGEGIEAQPISGNGYLHFQDGKCAASIIGYDAVGTEIRIEKALGKNGHVWDSVSKSWTEMGSPYVSSLSSGNPAIVAFNRAGGEFNSFCALAALGRVSDIDPADASLYTLNDSANQWVEANIAEYADGVATAAGLTGDEKKSAVEKIIAANSFGKMPSTKFYVYNVAGIVTIEDATDEDTFKITLMRLGDAELSKFQPGVPEGAPVTAVADFAKSYIDSLK